MGARGASRELRQRELLIMLDKCEHLIDACAELAETLLRVVPALKIVVTSREAWECPARPSVAFPRSRCLKDWRLFRPESLVEVEATRLFLERATAIDPAFRRLGERASIARICRRLDGMPLAIELAAARVLVLSLSRSTRLQDRFRLLPAACGRRWPDSGRSKRPWTGATSCCRMANGSCSAACRCSRPGGRSRPLRRSVVATGSTSDMLDLLSRLVSKSLVVSRTMSPVSGGTISSRRSAYARERLIQVGAADRLRERHFEFVFNEFRGVMPILRHHRQLPCLQRIRIELENVRAALEWALTSASLAEKGLELAGALFWFWMKRGLFEEGRLWLERALAVDQGAPAAASAGAHRFG